MKKYSVSLCYYASAFAEVEAENEEDAINKAAQEIMYPSLCHHCSSEVEIGEMCEDGHFAEEIE